MPLSSAELVDVKKVFDKFDSGKTGYIDAAQVTAASRSLNVSGGGDIKHVEGQISFEDFCKVIEDVKKGEVKTDLSLALAEQVVEMGMLKFSGRGGAEHTIPEEEKRAFADHVNSNIKDEKRLPINIETMDLFEKFKDGVLLCKLVNCSQPGTIDERVINDKKGKLSRFEISENIQLALHSARGVGCKVVNIGVEDIMEGRPHLVLGVISQLVRIQLLSNIDLRHVPELILLLEPGEELGDLLKLTAEKVLIRWMNFHLKKAGSTRTVANFSSDIKDSEAYTLLLNQLNPACDLSPLRQPGMEQRAAVMLQQANKFGVAKYVAPADVVNGNSKLNLAFVANIFNTNHGLTMATKEAPPNALEQLQALETQIDETDNREERIFRYWINSLGVDANCESLFDDVGEDGFLLLSILEKLQGSVDWKRVSKPPVKLPFKKMENLNYALDVARQPPIKAVLVGIQGKDVFDGNKKLTLALIWQLMRYDFMRTVSGISTKGGGAPTDSEVLKWANTTVQASGTQGRAASSFRDSSLADGIFLLDLLSAVDSHSVNWDLVRRGTDKASKEMNAKYIISVARKLGLGIFLLWEDIAEVNPKMMMQLTASVMAFSQAKARAPASAAAADMIAT